MSELIRTVGVVVLSKDERNVLLVENLKGSSHKTGIFGLPAGRIDEGETAEEAAKRELDEESGIIAKSLRELPKQYTARLPRKDGSEVEMHMVAFLCTEFDGELRETEETRPFWSDVRDFYNFELLPNVQDVVAHALQTVEDLRS